MSNNTLDETLDYELVVKAPINALPNGNGNGVYAIVNKQTNVTEAEVPFLVQGYEGLYEMQASLDNWRDKFDQNKKEKEEESEILIN
jgi:hypothetical protein|tara:strand:+ start:450 stop:710 length:261 start_codon:yes stop_codon:yes gene_type:complete